MSLKGFFHELYHNILLFFSEQSLEVRKCRFCNKSFFYNQELSPFESKFIEIKNEV